MNEIKDSRFCWINLLNISTLPILFFIVMVLGYINIISLNVPFHTVVAVGIILIIFLSFSKHNANYTICKMKSSHKKMQKTLSDNLDKHSLEIANEVKSILDIDNFLNRYYRGYRNTNFSSVASSIFPMLGILGTFLAIAISMPNFSSSNGAGLDGEISTLLSGVGSAFFASIYGISLSIIWTYFEKSGLSKVEIYYRFVKNIYTNKLWTQEELLLFKHRSDHAEEEKFINALKETFDLEFIRSVNKEHLADFQKSMGAMDTSFTKISNHLRLVSNELRETIAQVDTTTSAVEARTQMEKNIKEFTDVAKSIDINKHNFDKTFEKTFEKIDTEVGDIITKLADFATHVSLESREVQNSIRKYHQIVEAQIKVK